MTKQIFVYSKQMILGVSLCYLFSSCSITQGTIAPNSHYVYPNSNVTPLGNTSSKVSKFGFIFPPGFKARDLDKLYGNAMSRHSGSDLILDCKVDTRVTAFIVFYFMTTRLSGTAAKMEVGKQDIGQADFDSSTPVNRNEAKPTKEVKPASEPIQQTGQD